MFRSLLDPLGELWKGLDALNLRNALAAKEWVIIPPANRAWVAPVTADGAWHETVYDGMPPRTTWMQFIVYASSGQLYLDHLLDGAPGAITFGTASSAAQFVDLYAPGGHFWGNATAGGTYGMLLMAYTLA